MSRKCMLCENLFEGNGTRVYDMSNEEELIICNHCITNNSEVFYCDGHNRFEIDEDNMWYDVIDYGRICYSIYENSDEFIWCAECDELFHEDNMYFNEDEDCYFCYECNEVISSLPSYHSHSYNEFLELDNEVTNQYYGIELEVELKKGMSYPMKNVVEDIKPIIDEEFVIEKDCSLRNGFEIISNPFSYNYMVENLEGTIKELCENLEYAIDESANTNGMHIHITKQNHKHMINMVALMEYYQKEMTILSNRRPQDLKRWAKFLIDIENYNLLNMRMIENEIDYDYRYFSVNVSNSKTLEVRIFKSSNDYKEIIGRVELVRSLSEFAKENTIDENFKNMPSFIEIANYKESRYVNYILEKYNLIDVATC